MSLKQTRLATEEILETAEGDREACARLAVATTESTRQHFLEYLQQHCIPENFPIEKYARSIIFYFATWVGSSRRSFPNLSAALAYRHKEKVYADWCKQQFIETAGINWKAVDKEALLQSIPAYAVPMLSEPYPPPKTFMAETKAIRKHHAQFLLRDKLHDKRDTHKPITMFEENRLQLDIGPREDAHIYDAEDGSLIGMVV